MRRSGFTIIELLVTLAILGLLIALILPAIQQAREAARRTQCRSNLKQIGIALHSYDAVHGMLAPGSSKGYSLHIFLLPHVDERALYGRADFSILADDNKDVRQASLPLYSCPSDPISSQHVARGFGTNYAGNFGTGVQRYGYNGLFGHLLPSSRYPNGAVRASDVTDGLSNTAAIAEIRVSSAGRDELRVNWNTPSMLDRPDELDLFAEYCDSVPISGLLGDLFGRGRPWSRGDAGITLYNHVLPPNSKSCFNGTKVQTGAFSAGSLHSGGVHVLYGDGHVRFVSESVGLAAWRALGSRNGGEAVIPDAS